jgi:hypothetical protein
MARRPARSPHQPGTMDKPAAPLSARVRHAGSGLGLATGAVTAAVWQLWPSGGWAGWQLLGTLGAACLTGGLLGAWWSRQVLRQLAAPAADRTDSEWPPTLLATPEDTALELARRPPPAVWPPSPATPCSSRCPCPDRPRGPAHPGHQPGRAGPVGRAGRRPLLQQPLPALFQAGDARACRPCWSSCRPPAAAPARWTGRPCAPCSWPATPPSGWCRCVPCGCRCWAPRACCPG